MTKNAAMGTSPLLEVGRRVIVSSLQKPGSELPSKITRVSAGTLHLQSTRPTAGWSFEEGDLIRVICIEAGVLYCWDGAVETVSDGEQRTVTFSLTSEGVPLIKGKIQGYRSRFLSHS